MPGNDIGVLDTLTAKQREVMDLLIQHKTSKEIARELSISPHTVDQRVQFAKERLKAESRSEAAVEYRRLVELRQSVMAKAPDPSEKGTSDELPGVEGVILPDSAGQQDGYDDIPRTPLEQGGPAKKAQLSSENRVVPAMFEARHGTFIRLGAIVLMTLLLLFIALGGVAIFESLSRGFAS